MPDLDLTAALVIAVGALASVIACLGGVIAILWKRGQRLADENRLDGRQAIEALTLSVERERAMQEAAAAQERSVREAGAVVGKLDRQHERLDVHREQLAKLAGRLEVQTDRIERRGA